MFIAEETVPYQKTESCLVRGPHQCKRVCVHGSTLNCGTLPADLASSLNSANQKATQSGWHHYVW